MTWLTIQNEIALAKKDILKRGFKANAERLAKQYREELSVHPCAALCAFKLAEHLQVPLCKSAEFLNLPNEISTLSAANGVDCGWSALTMIAKSGTRIILYNEYHSEARQQSDIMHELAHVICKHERKQKQYDFEIPFGMREFDEVQEEEAKCLGSTLQLPSPALLWANKRNMAHDEIATHFNASQDMVKYRMNMTGIAKRKYFTSKAS